MGDKKRKTHTTQDLPRAKRSSGKTGDTRRPETSFREIAKIIKEFFEDALAKLKVQQVVNNSATFIKQHKVHPEILGFQTLVNTGKHGDVRRDRWKEFLSNTNAKDLKKIYQFFARADGRVATSHRPACLDPLEVEGCLHFRPEEEADVLGTFFEEKTAATSGKTKKLPKNAKRK